MSNIWDYAASISDDDPCSTCKHLRLGTAPFDVCELIPVHGAWPSKFDEDEQTRSCDYYESRLPETTPRSDVQTFSNSICPHCGEGIRVTLERSRRRFTLMTRECFGTSSADSRSTPT